MVWADSSPKNIIHCTLRSQADGLLGEKPGTKWQYAFLLSKLRYHPIFNFTKIITSSESLQNVNQCNNIHWRHSLPDVKPPKAVKMILIFRGVTVLGKSQNKREQTYSYRCYVFKTNSDRNFKKHAHPANPIKLGLNPFALTSKNKCC